MVTFEDPKGTVLEVFAEQTPIAKNQAVAGVGPLKLGHLAFCVPDPKEFADFYGRVLGFRVSDWIQDWFVFMRCGPDHHTVNFVRGKRTQMHHIAFELKDWAQILTACDFLGGKNIHADLGTGPARAGPQPLHLSPQSGRPDHRAVRRARQDARRGPRLFRAAAVAPRPSAEAEGVGAGARHLGHAADAGLHPPARIAARRPRSARSGDRRILRVVDGLDQRAPARPTSARPG